VNVLRWIVHLRLKAQRVGSATRPMLISVLPESCQVHGLSFRTNAELEAFLVAYRPAHVRVVPMKTTAYEAVHEAIRSVQRAGAHIGLSGAEQKG